jgi:hypothetical protein
MDQRKKLMTKQKRTKLSIIGLVSLTLTIAAATYGFAGASTVPSAGLLGVDYGIDSPYDVSHITYTLDMADPTTFTAVVFELDQSGGSILAGVSPSEHGQITWADDCQRSGSRWTCTFGESVDVLAADWLHVASD